MKLEIKRMADKSKGEEVKNTYTATIDGKVYVNYHIARALFGITDETQQGIFDEYITNITLNIGSDTKLFTWNKIDPDNPQIEIQRRINDVKAWIATLDYFKEYKFTVEV